MFTAISTVSPIVNVSINEIGAVMIISENQSAVQFTAGEWEAVLTKVGAIRRQQAIAAVHAAASKAMLDDKEEPPPLAIIGQGDSQTEIKAQ